MVNKARTSAFGAGSVSVSKFSDPVDIPKISSIAYVGDDTATNTAGGDTITINGSFFKSGCYVYVDRTQASVVSFISSSQITFIAPAKSAGTYTLYVYNPDGGTAIYIPGISYSGTPTWSTAAGSIGTAYETVELSSNVTVLSATSDSTVKYRLYSGSLPTNAVLNTNTGAITGVTASVAGVTTYTFVIEAYDLENQGTLRTFSITLNPDVVTWNSPADGSTITVTVGTAVNQTLNASSLLYKTITYTANTLPTGLSISGNTVTGTPTVGQTITSLITATAATTNKIATRILNWIINASDSYFPYVSLLLKTASTSTRSLVTTDSSVSTLTVSRNGAPSTAWTSPYQTSGYWSNYFDGSTSRLTTTTSSAFDLSATNFTLEFWMYMTANPSGAYNRIITTGANGLTSSIAVQFSTSGQLSVAIIGPSGAGVTGPVIPLNTWTHVAFTLSTSTGTLYINGSQYAQTTGWSITSANGYFYVGYDTAGTVDAKYNGYVSNVRLVKGVVVYTGNFTPPTSPLAATQSAGTNISAITGTATSILTCQSNRFLDNSTNNFAITPTGTPKVTPYWYPSAFSTPDASIGAAYFNGNSSYLVIAANTIFAYGTGDFTVEGWFYFTGTTSGRISNRAPNGGLSGTWALNFSSTTLTFTEVVVGEPGVTASGLPVMLNTWTHLAASRSGTTLRLFANGILVGSGTNSTDFNSSANPLVIGTTNGTTTGSGETYFPGYISNLRIVKGTAVYTGNFTPPTNFLTQTGGTYPNTANVNTSITASNTSLLLNFSDNNYTSVTNTSNNNTFIDSSPYAFPVTRSGTPTQGSVTPYWPNGQWSNYFDGSSYLTTPYVSGFDVGTGDLTLECWVYPTSVSGVLGILSNHPSLTGGGFGMYTNNGVLNSELFTTGGAASNSITGGTLSLNTWYHVAMTRSSGTMYLWLNGVSQGSTASSRNPNNSSGFYIGSYEGALYKNVGYISNIRFVKGQALATGNFTPPTSPVTSTTVGWTGANAASSLTGTVQLLINQSNRFKDNSINNLSMTVSGGTPKVQAFQPFSPTASYTTALYGGSAYFSGATSTYLNTPMNSALAIGTNSFTIECWIYMTALPTSGQVAAIMTNRASNAGATGSWYFVIDNSGALRFDQVVAVSPTIITTASSAITINSWIHVAVTRDVSNVWRLFINGVSSGTSSPTNAIDLNYQSAGGLFIGYNWDANNASFSGYINNLRFVNGTPVYTGAFTPPTTLVTAIPNTSLLLNYNNSGIYDASGQNNLITVSTAQVSTTTAKWNTTSMKFNGTSDNLTLLSSPGLSFSTGNFTIECWIYNTSSAAVDKKIFSYWNNSTESYQFYLRPSNRLVWQIWTQNPPDVAALDVPVNTWTHVAMSKSGTTVYLFIDGVLKDTTTGVTNSANGAGTPKVGMGTSSEYFPGYIQDLRITRGVARYTSNFSVPTSEFITR